MNILKYLICSLLLSGVSTAFAVVETYQFDTEAQRQRYEHFIEILRCPKCQNQNLAGSNSPIAEDLRFQLVRQLKEGKQDQEIIDFMVARYGDYVLYDPPFKKITYVLWLAPLFLLIIGFLVVVLITRSNRQRTEQVDAIENPVVTAHIDQSSPDEGKDKYRALIFFAVAVVFVSAGTALLYRHLGASEQLKITEVTERFYGEINKAAAEKRKPDLGSGRELVALLLPYLEKHSDDLNLVYELGSVYAQLSEFENALPWYKQYLLAVPTDERVLTEYVQLLYITANQELTERVLFVVDRALELNPHNTEVLTLMAMHYHQRGEYKQAADYWQRLLVALPTDAEIYPTVQKALADARHHSKK
jgi:cytochrome c-type biogenesis protein CcmH